MNRNRAIVGSVLFLLLVLLVLWLWLKTSFSQTASNVGPTLKSGSLTLMQSSGRQQAPSPLTKEEEKRIRQEKRQKVLAHVEAMLNTPITFYGKVVDQNGDRVPVARVAYSLLDSFNASGSNGREVADVDGYFEISGVEGAVLGINVSKEGYYQIHNVSNQRFAYGTGVDTYTKSPPTKNNPAVFVLHKMGQTEPLVRMESRTFRVPRDGSAVEVDLMTGRTSPKGHVRIEAWTNDQTLDSQGNYDWKCRVSIPGGGLLERTGQFDFEAPAEGYRAVDEITMSQMAERWQPQVQRSYFIKLADGRYARIEFKMVAGGDHFFRMESFLNLKPESRNLEYDPAKTVKP